MSKELKEIDELLEKHERGRRWLLPVGIFFLVLPILGVIFYFWYYQDDMQAKGNAIENHEGKLNYFLDMFGVNADSVESRGGGDKYTILLSKIDSLQKCCEGKPLKPDGQGESSEGSDGDGEGAELSADDCIKFTGPLKDKIKTLNEDLKACEEGEGPKEVIIDKDGKSSGCCQEPPWEELYNLRGKWIAHNLYRDAWLQDSAEIMTLLDEIAAKDELIEQLQSEEE